MTYPPQGSGEHEDPDRHATQPAPSFERPQQPVQQPVQQPPAAPWQGPTRPYGQASQSYGEPSSPASQPSYGQPSHGQPPYGQPPHGQLPHGQPPHGQPAYGQPQYGPPSYGRSPSVQPYGQPQSGQPWQQPPAPPQKSKVGLIAAVTAVILLVIAGVVVGVLTLQSTVLDPAAVERDVAAQFEEREGVPIDLSCDEEMTVDSGKTYECTGTTADGEDVTLEIRIEDEDSAAYTWTEP
ncbi:DUF4333 domain-containing protein [Blastococcus sp. PRF04-17]|uniref:DUF4333 domain-containing protein n=1 Tax=Blastococcus sp. PRF04-17 TaxID=2933797 RepID=UPI001FF5479C|nr:DUF4333 domain-containing protein [Blastococcus sp. PRF04-17]UOY02515.1 DUF4333 domain-containing protein [Blastococcus sp. PRF04-17]